MGSKEVFTKMNLRWGFNNVRIKEEDEWKGAFTMHVGFFEPIVMFFRMMNLPAIFQAIMNEILRDLINKEKVTAFVNDVLVGTETEKRHDEIVKEILKSVRAIGVDSRRFFREIIVWNMLQLTSRRFLRELDEASGGNNLQYILKCPYIPFFGN